MLAFVPFYIKYLGIESYGLIGIFGVIQIWLSLIDGGITQVIIREVAGVGNKADGIQYIRNLIRSIEIMLYTILFIFTFVVWIGSNSLAVHWVHAESISINEVAGAFSLMGVYAALGIVENFYKSILIGCQRQVMLNVAMSIIATVRGLGSLVLLLWVSQTIIDFFLWQVALSLASVIFYMMSAYGSILKHPGKTCFSVDVLKPIRPFFLGTVAISFFGFLMSQSDKIILSKMVSLELFGFYTVAYLLSSSIRILAQPIDQAICPKLIKYWKANDVARLIDTYHKASQLTAVIVGGVGIFIIFFGGQVLELWIGNKNTADNVYPILWILTVGMVLNVMMHGPGNIQMVLGRTTLGVKTNLLLAIIFLPLIYVLVLNYSVIGAAISWVLLNIGYVLVVPKLMHKEILVDGSNEWYIKDWLLPLLAAFSMASLLKIFIPELDSIFTKFIYLVFVLALLMGSALISAGRVRAMIFVLYETFFKK